MKKIIITLLFLIPFVSFAATTPVPVLRDTSGFITPLINTDYIKSIYFESTTGTSTLPKLSIQTGIDIFGTFANALSDLCVAITGSADLCDGSDDGAGGSGDPFAWTTETWGVSTSTTLGFLNGFLSTASSTFTDILRGNNAIFSSYVDAPYFTATSTTATSTFAGAVQIGSTARNNALSLTASRNYPVSTSVGGMMSLVNTNNTGLGFGAYTDAGGTATGRLMNLRCDNDAFGPACLHIDYDGTGNAFEITASSTQNDAVPLTITNKNWTASTIGISSDVENHGIIKSIHTFPATGAGRTENDAVASHISLDSQGVGTAVQGIFMTSTTNGGGTTGKLINLRNRTVASNAEDEYLTLTYNGKMGLLDSAPTARLDIVATSTDDYLYISTTNTANGNIFSVLNNGNIGIGTTSPYAKLSVVGETVAEKFTVTSTTATSTLPRLSITTGISILGEYFENFTTYVRSLFTATSPINITAGVISLGDVKQYPAFTYATSTAWTATTTIALAPAYVDETWNGVKCFTDVGTVNVSFYDGTNRMNMLNASTTVGTFTLSTNNSFTASEKRYVDIGTPASSPTKISCTVSKTLSIN